VATGARSACSTAPEANWNGYAPRKPFSPRAQLFAARLKIVVDSTSDGIALFDSKLRPVQWNRPFQRGIGIELQQDMALEDMLRAQTGTAMFDSGATVETEIGRRLAVLRSGDAAGVPQPGPNRETLILRGLPIGEAGFIALLGGLGSWHSSPAPPPPSGDHPMVSDAITSSLIEW
jgi:PAS domain-containing protein